MKPIYIFDPDVPRRTICIGASYQYAFRGGELRDLCALEYAMLCVLKKEDVRPECPEEHQPNRGQRPCNAAFQLDHRHVLSAEGFHNQ